MYRILLFLIILPYNLKQLNYYPQQKSKITDYIIMTSQIFVSILLSANCIRVLWRSKANIHNLFVCMYVCVHKVTDVTGLCD